MEKEAGQADLVFANCLRTGCRIELNEDLQPRLAHTTFGGTPSGASPPYALVRSSVGWM